MEVKKKTRAALTYAIGSAVLKFSLSVLSMVLLVRYLEPSEYGVYAIMVGLPQLIHQFTSFGYPQWITRFVPMMQDTRKVGDAILSVLIRRMVLVAFVSLAIILGFNLYAQRIGVENYYLHILVYQIAVLAQLAYIYLKWTLHAHFMQRYVLLLDLIYYVLFFVVVLVGVNLQEDLLFFIIGFTACIVTRFVVSSVVFIANFRPTSWAEVLRRHPESIEQRSYRRISYINQFGVSFLNTGIDKYIVAAVSNNVQVAIYVVAVSILNKIVIFFPHQMLRPLVEPAFYSRYEQQKTPEVLGRMFEFLFKINVIISFLFLSVFIPLGKELLEFVFTEQYSDAYLPALMFMFFLVFYSIPLGMVSKALKEPKFLLYSKVAAVFNIATGIPLAAAFGALGMAISTVLSVVLKNAIILFFVRRRIDLHIPWDAMLKATFHTLLTVVAVVLMPQATPLILKCVIAGIVYLAASRSLPVFDASQARLLVSLLPRRLRPIINWYLIPSLRGG
jgi:O-antigen/teichoic acid export membrane protein